VPRLGVAWLVLPLVLAAAPALARAPVDRPDNLLDDRFGLTLDIIDSSNSTQARIDASTGAQGTVVNGEGDLGLKSRKVLGLGEVMMRMRERWRMRIDYYFVPLDRSGSTVLKRQINFKDAQFQPGDQINSQFGVHLFGLNWAYSFLKGERYELAASLGFDALELSAVGTDAARVSTQRQERSEPAPLVGLDGTVQLASHWYLDARLQYLRAHISHITGRVTSWEASALYRVTPNITLGLGMRSFDLAISSTSVGNSGMLDVKSQGPQLSVRVGF
jgi:hypothetical protein